MDVRVAQSRRLLKAALRDLMLAEELETISISRLCKAAGVSRPTFYQHFGTVDDVLAAVVRDRLSEERRKLREDPEVGDALARSLAYIQEHREELALTLDSRRSVPRARQATIGWLRDTVALARYGSPFDRVPRTEQAQAIFAVGGLVAIFEDQLSGGHTANLDAEELSRIVRETMATVLQPARAAQA